LPEQLFGRSTVDVMEGTSVERVINRARHLHAVELDGESLATPVIVLAEVVLFLIPILLAISAVTFAAYYLGR
jgi:hypothetical protein